MVQIIDEEEKENFKNSLWGFLPLNVQEQILCETVFLNIKHACFSQLDYQTNKLNQNISLKFLRKKKQINFETFEFLNCVDKEFINVTKHPSLLKNIIYKNIKLDMNITYLKNIVEMFVNKEDLDTCLIAGGFFTKYKIDDQISIRFPNLFSKLNAETDIDIYLNLADLSQFKDSLTFNMNSKNIKTISEFYGKNKNPYGFSSLKIETKKGEKINFIASKINENYSCFDHIRDFDLDHSKIFYFYKYDSIFIHVSFFEQFEKLQSFFMNEKKRKDEVLKKEKLSNKYLFKEKFWGKKLTKEDRLIVLNYFSFLRKFPAPKINFLRFCKYCFKGFYSKENCEKYVELIDFFINNGNIEANYF